MPCQPEIDACHSSIKTFYPKRIISVTVTPIWDYPPLPYLEQVLQHCHKAASTYLSLWKGRNKHNKLTVAKDKIKTDFLTSVATFNHNLRLLARECLINVTERPLTLEIELVGWDFEGDDVC
jgi:hypothetical protein